MWPDMSSIAAAAAPTTATAQGAIEPDALQGELDARLDLLIECNNALKDHIAKIDAGIIRNATHGGLTGIGTNEVRENSRARRVREKRAHRRRRPTTAPFLLGVPHVLSSPAAWPQGAGRSGRRRTFVGREETHPTPGGGRGSPTRRSARRLCGA